MRRAFTLTEMLVALGVIATVAGILFPVIVSAKQTAIRSNCVSNLKQLGIALAIYRENHSGSEWGTPVQMGLPPHLGHLKAATALRCKGRSPDGEVPGYYMRWPDPDDHDAAGSRAANWSQYVSKFGTEAVLIEDPNHQAHLPKSRQWENWTVLGLRADGSVKIRTNLGYPFGNGWWHE